MIKVVLTNGKEISVAGATTGEYISSTITKTEEIPTDVGVVLKIKSDNSYSGKVLATFDKAAVLGFYFVNEEGDASNDTSRGN